MSSPSTTNDRGEPLPPDIMNDAEYATNMNLGGDGDTDSCRICRSEGTATEPLFYPCKCSGSIKHVHQECLMLWLSHSQKKHCELCKTPFRFTKLYSPNMPKNIPARVLANHLGTHTIRYLKTCLRLCLVIIVWLVCLPYAIRQVWSLIFWFSDGGWPLESPGAMPVQHYTRSQTVEIVRDVLLAKVAGNGTSPATPLLATETTPATMGEVFDQLAALSRLTDPLVAGLFATLYSSFGFNGVDLAVSGATASAKHEQGTVAFHPSSSRTLLSEVPFFNTMSRHPAINQLTVAVAEGYIITILVVISFILVFLIREWVVQQQPGINVGAGFNARLGEADRPAENQIPPAQPAAEAVRVNRDPGLAIHGANPPAMEELIGNGARVRPVDTNNFIEQIARGNVPDPIQAQDGAVGLAQDWAGDVERDQTDNPDSDEDELEEMAEPHILRDDLQLNVMADVDLVIPVQPRRIADRAADWFWGEAGRHIPQDDQDANDERVVVDVAAEPPFVPVNNAIRHNQRLVDDIIAQDPEVAAAARAAGIDPNDLDGVDDIEDFEGILELIGMRGPFFNLFQNALFSTFLLSLTIAFGIWIPYNIGRIALLLIAHPVFALKLPLRIAYGMAAFLQDLALCVAGYLSYCAIVTAKTIFKLAGFSISQNSSTKIASLGLTVWQLSASAIDRILGVLVHSMVHFADSEMFAFSAASHESLLNLKTLCTQILFAASEFIAYPFVEEFDATSIYNTSNFLLRSAVQHASHWPELLAKPESWVISLEVGKRSAPLDMGLSVWSGWDRFWAVFSGYSALSALGVLYVRKGSPFSTSDLGKDWEASTVDFLNQAGGVMKVILIISIEMLAFPLYCGLLLDAALLPLFANATISSRIAFTSTNPLTSIFVHWFVGTCYMFHFALFVSMCRKIMRKGVLYFIRDPDDPTFHPVRDVLERNIATQLRKILFSALIYGALVIICLGGVVWGIAYTFEGVLPIHWSSNEPVLEFPVDLLFYNFLMPLAVRFFKPSDGLHSMYSWWFRKCARMLRLTWFMFGERQPNEEGYVVHCKWTDRLRGLQDILFEKNEAVNETNSPDQSSKPKICFQHDGRYVRAPASDQVRVPKGVGVFLEVDESNNRIDGTSDRPNDVHKRDSGMYTHVYIPPWFRLRICLFIIYIWLFAAITGVSTTLVPLVVGRKVFGMLIPSHVRKNDVYAFSIGIYILGTALYIILHLRKFILQLPTMLSMTAATPQNILRRLQSIGSRIARIAITYAAFLIALPALFAFFVEFYFILPLHTYLAIREDHVMHLVQSWTLGLLYVKLTTRIILWHENSRPAQSIRAITRNGYLDPDARLAMRAFVIPATLVLGTALVVPWVWARFVVRFILYEYVDAHYLIYRLAYPLTLGFIANSIVLWKVVVMMGRWRMRVRDEVYLIGERLHNFGDRKSAGAALAVPRARRVTT